MKKPERPRSPVSGERRSPRDRGSAQQRQNARNVCKVAECGRRAYARSLCQTHHRQLLTLGKTTRIRPYRERSPGTVKFAGLRLTPACVEVVKAYAKERELSRGAAIAGILEDWTASRRGGPSR